MICPFRVHTKTRKQIEDFPERVNYKETTCTFEDCQGDICPFYYKDKDDMPKCIRCTGPEEN